MKFYQRYKISEHGYGEQTITFAVADNFSELFQSVGNETDIFVLEAIKKDLNTEEGSFAIDELPFSINSLACRSENDRRALYFVLDAADIKVNRYCAVFFGLESFENTLFVGKISDKISGEDKLWRSISYDIFINPERIYKFIAYSFDISILERCKMTGKIESPLGGIVANVYQRFEDEDWESIKDKFNYRLTYAIDNVINNKVYVCPLANLFEVIQEYLYKARDIIYELTNTWMQLYLQQSSLGIQTSPVRYKLKRNTDIEVNEIAVETTKRIELRLYQAQGDETWSSIFIHRKLVDPNLGTSGYDWQKNQASSELNFSFKRLDNVSELLFEIARSFGCYVFANYVSGNVINFEFKSRKSLVDNDYTYIVGAQDADFNTSSIITKEANEYYGLANNKATDGFDSIISKPNSSDYEPSSAYRNYADLREDNANKRGVKYDRLMLTTSCTKVTLCAENAYGGKSYYSVPINVTHNTTWNTQYLQLYAYPPSLGGAKSYEMLNSGIYIRVKPFEEEQIARLGDTPVWRPAMKIYTKINDDSKDFDTLTDYVNYIMARDKHYYETEYTLTVPFWNGFAKNNDGSDASWRNVKLGSKIKLSENVIRYVGGNWQTQIISKDYVVVGIEINLQKPETKLKLHSLDRFAFGYWSGNEADIRGLILKSDEEGFETENEVIVKLFDVEHGEQIYNGDAVMILSNGKIAKSVNNSQYYGKTIGIAKQNGIGGSKILVQISGKVESDNYNFGYIGQNVYVRKNNNGLNVSQQILQEAANEEDTIIILGIAENSRSFILNIKEFVYEGVGT